MFQSYPLRGVTDYTTAKKNYEDIGDGYVVRIDKVNIGGEARFEVHVYKDSPSFQKAAASNNDAGLRKAEINTRNAWGTWGKHGKNGDIPSTTARAGLDKLVNREASARGLMVGPGGKYIQASSSLGKLVKLGRILGLGAAIEQTTPSIVRGCEYTSSMEDAGGVCN